MKMMLIRFADIGFAAYRRKKTLRYGLSMLAWELKRRSNTKVIGRILQRGPISGCSGQLGWRRPLRGGRRGE
jgi:hypothetical protein